MPGLLGPTNPVPGYEQPQVRITTPAPGDTTVQNIVDPGRVVRPDARTDRQDTGDTSGAGVARYESNFMTFLQRLRDSGDLPEVFLRMMQGMEISSGIRTGFSEEIGQFLEFLQMDESQLLSFLQNQVESGSRFSGALFQALRTAYEGSQSELLKNEILQFVRRFSDFSSTEHLEGKILRTASDIREAMPARWGDQLTDVLAKLENGVAADDRRGNLELLRGQLFPLVSQYVSATHDHGLARSLLSMLTLDVARYENGGEAGLLQSMRHLSALGVLPEGLSTLSDEELTQLLKDTEFTRASRDNAFADRLAELTDRALQGEGGPKVQEAFHHIMNSVLINESVYMPLQHVMLPLEWNGQLMFSEMWVDPDAEKERSARGGEPRTIRLLIKMDIQSLGAFDVLINAKADSVSLQVTTPPGVAAHTEDVSSALRAILERNGFRAEEVSVAEMKRPVTVSEIFPKLFERMSGVNVKV